MRAPMPAQLRSRLLSSDSAHDGSVAMKDDPAGMRADSSRSSDGTASGGGGLSGDGGATTPARWSRQGSSQHSASDEDPTVLMCGCLGPTGARRRSSASSFCVMVITAGLSARWLKGH